MDVQRGSEVPLIGSKVLRPRQQVEERIRTAILSGELPPGSRLPSEAELARQFDVSRNTVREALGGLVTMKLITKVPGSGGGSFVQSVDHHALTKSVGESVGSLLALGRIEFAEVDLARQFLEVPVARLAAKNRTDADLEAIHANIDRQKVTTYDDPSIVELDTVFHSAVAAASRNRVLSSLVVALHSQLAPVRFLHMSPEVGRNGVLQHQAIAAALDRGDQEEAGEAMLRHLDYLRLHSDPRATD
jgi:GntR family transcriptional regulator, transcriptional repressor for pyruvate dehydrogenase complex